MKKYIIIITIILSTNLLYAQWVQLEQFTDNTLLSVFFIDADTGYAAGDNGIIAKTNDGGMNWEVQTVGEDMDVFSLYFPNNSTGYALGRIGHMVHDPCVFLKTVDGGMNWSINVIDSSFSFNELYFTSEDTGYICGYYNPGGVTTGLILKTTNGGNDWSTMYEGSGPLESLHFPSSNTGYVMGYSSTGGIQHYWIMQKTVDAGQTWITSYGPPNSQFPVRSVYFTDEDNGYTVGKNTLLRTTDGGTNWIVQEIGKSSSSVFFTSLTTGYITAGPGVFHTIDGGENWKYDSIGGNGLYSVHFPTMDTGYVVGYLGDIFKTTNGGIPLGINIKTKDNEKFILYPNPCTSTTTITYSLNKSTNVSIHVFNSQGQLIEVIEQQQAKGRQEVIWNSEGLPSGMYFYHIQTCDLVGGGRIVKME